MKHRIFLLLSVLLLTLALVFTLASCGNNKTPPNGGETGGETGGEDNPPAPVHKAREEWESDHTSHRHACTECSEHTYDVAEHTFTANGRNKKCSVCQREAEYTDEENCLYFLVGRDFTMSYRGSYTARYLAEVNASNDRLYRVIERETYGGDSRYFFSREGGHLNDDGSLQRSDWALIVLRAVLDGEVARTKHYVEALDEENPDIILKKGEYVSPRYYEDGDRRFLSPAEQLEGCYIERGDTYESFVAGVYALAGEDGGRPDSVAFTRAEDGSVTLTITFSGEEYNESMGATDTYRTVLSLTVKDGRIVRTVSDFYDEYAFDNTEENYTEHAVRTTEFSYEFDEELSASVSIETEQTPNHYYADISIEKSEYGDSVFYNDVLVGTVLTAQDVVDYLSARTYLIIGNDENLGMFRLYTDKARTIPFTEVTLGEELTLYLEFVAPEGYATVVTMFDGEYGKYVKLVYLWELGEYFYPRDRFGNYEVLSVDGRTDFAYSGFLCSESRVYTVVYKDVYLEEPPTVDHFGVGDWVYDESAHRHVCSECGYETFDFGVHDFIPNGKNKKCSVCDYETDYTAEENFRELLVGLGYTLTYDGDYTYASDYKSTDGEKVLSIFYLVESLSGQRYYQKEKLCAVPPMGGDLTQRYETVVAVKTVDVDGVERIKYYHRMDDTAQGTYKKPSFHPSEIARYLPERWFDFCFLSSATSYESFCEEIVSQNLERFGYTVTNIAVTRTDDGSVRLSFRAAAEGDFDAGNYEGAGYLKTAYANDFSFFVKDGKIVSYFGSYRTDIFFEDETKNEAYFDEETIRLSYAFDTETYDAISVETETTNDEYVSGYEFIVEGHRALYSMGNIPVGKTVTPEDITLFLSDYNSSYLFVPTVPEEYRSMFKVYTDEAMTIPFTSTVTPEAGVTLYVKLEVPEGKAVVMTILERNGGQAIHLCYLRDVGEDKTFRTSYVMQGNRVLTVDGVDVPDGETPPDIPLTENRVYKVTYAWN